MIHLIGPEAPYDHDDNASDDQSGSNYAQNGVPKRIERGCVAEQDPTHAQRTDEGEYRTERRYYRARSK